MNKVLQIQYEKERNLLTWDGWDITSHNKFEVLLPDKLGGGTWRQVTFALYDGFWTVKEYPNVLPIGLWAREV